MRSGLVRRGAVAAAAVLALSACGSGDDDAGTPDPSPTSSSSPSGSSGAAEGDYPYDTTFSGDDLLVADQSSLVIPGTDQTIVWRVPEGYAPDASDELGVTAYGPGKESYVEVNADLDSDLESTADLTRTRAAERGLEARSSTVQVGDRDAVAFEIQFARRKTLRVYFELDETTVAIVDYATFTPATEPTPETVKAFNQMVASVALGSS